jgi:hypothetical protein
MTSWTNSTIWLDPKRLHQNLLVNHDQRYVFINNPKCASSTVKRELWDLERAKGRRKGEPTPTSIHGNGFLKGAATEGTEDYFWFAVVRNPYTRILSAYLDKLGSGFRAPGAAFRFQAGLPQRAKVTFETFVRSVSKSLPYEDDRHWAPQTDNLLSGAFRIDCLGSVENMPGLLRRLGDEIGIVRPDPSRSRHATGAVNKVAEYFTPELRDLVVEKYSEDFAFFGYSDDPAKVADPPASDGARLEEDAEFARLAQAYIQPGAGHQGLGLLHDCSDHPRYGFFCRAALADLGTGPGEGGAEPIEAEQNPLVVRGWLEKALRERQLEEVRRCAAVLIEKMPQSKIGWVADAALRKLARVPDKENAALNAALSMTWKPGRPEIRRMVRRYYLSFWTQKGAIRRLLVGAYLRIVERRTGRGRVCKD